MNNNDFKQHCINVLLESGIEDYEIRTFLIIPIYEEGKKYSEFPDDFMRLSVFPKPRRLTFDEFIKAFTIKEGYYPCWMEIIDVSDVICINTSLRMRKRSKTVNINKNHPFHVNITDNKEEKL